MQQLRTLLRQSSALLGATLIVNACSFLLNLYIGRSLGPAQYGVLGAILSLYYVLIILAGAIQTAAMRFASATYVSRDETQLAGLLERLLTYLAIANIVIVIFLALSGPTLSTFLSLGSVWAILALALLLACTLLLAANRGVLQGQQRFGSVSINMSLEAVGRLPFAFVFLKLGYGPIGVVFGYASAALLAYIITWFHFPHPQRVSDSLSIQPFVRFVVPVVITYLAFAWMTNVDVLLAKRFLNADLAGYYVAITTLAKLLIFIATALTDLMLSHLSANHNARRGRIVLYQTIGILAGLSLASIVVTSLFADRIILTIYGNSFAPAAEYLGKAFLSSSIFTLVIIYAKAALIQGQRWSMLFLLGGGGFETLLLTLFHSSIDQILDLVIVCTLVALVLLVVSDYLGRNRGITNHLVSTTPRASGVK